MKFVRPLLRHSLAATLLLWLPLVIFLRHNQYPLFTSEVMILLGIFAIAGLFWGGVMTAGRTAARVAVVTALAVLVVDVQTDWITTWGLRLLLSILVFGTLAWFLRRPLAGAVILLAGLMILGTLVTPTGPAARRAGLAPGEGDVHEDLPFVLHLLLDEHAGIEGIPRRYDPERRLANLIRDDYEALGFTVFGRAYSRYYNTRESIPNALNFTNLSDNEHYYRPHFRKGSLLKENAWFALLKEKGYRVHVVQTDFMSFHRTDDSAGPQLADGSLTIPSETVGSLVGLDIPSPEKARFILGSYQRLSFFLKMFRDRVRRSAPRRPAPPELGPVGRSAQHPLFPGRGGDPGPQNWRRRGRARRFSSTSCFCRIFPTPCSRTARPGPCPGTWLNAFDESLEPVRNDDRSRDLRYPLYLEQLECAAFPDHGNAREPGVGSPGGTRPSWWSTGTTGRASTGGPR